MKYISNTNYISINTTGHIATGYEDGMHLRYDTDSIDTLRVNQYISLSIYNYTCEGEYAWDINYISIDTLGHITNAYKWGDIFEIQSQFQLAQSYI